MDKIDSKDQILKNFKNNKMYFFHIFYLITILIFNNLKQFDYIKTNNVDNKEKSELPKFNSMKSSIISIFASLGIFFYLRSFGKSLTTSMLKNDLWSKDTGLYSILNFPITMTSFIIILISIMMILRLLQYHVGGTYIEKNTYKNNPSGITLNEDNLININMNNFIAFNKKTNINLPTLSNNNYSLTNNGILYNNTTISKLNKDDTAVNKISFEKDKLILIDENENVIENIFFDNKIANFNNLKLRMHLTNLGNLMIIEYIENTEEIIPQNNNDNFNINLKDKYNLIWQSGGNSLPVEEGQNTNILNNSYSEITTKKLVSSTGSVYLNINENSIDIQRTDKQIIWEKKINSDKPLEAVRISENYKFQYRTEDSDTFIDVPGFSNINMKYLELKSDGNLVAYNKNDESVWMSREGMFNGKNFTDITGVYLIYGLVFYLIEYTLVNQPWYVGFIRKLIRTLYVAIGFVLMSTRIGINMRNVLSFIFLFFFVIVFMLWKTKNLSKNSNKKGTIYLTSFLVFATIQVSFYLIRKFSLFPIDLSKKWTNEVDDIECNTNILEIFSNTKFNHSPSRYIFFIITGLMLLPIFIFAFNTPSLYMKDTSRTVKGFLKDKYFNILLFLWIFANIVFSIISLSINSKIVEGNLIYANYHKVVNFISIIVCTLFVLSKLINYKEENLYYNYFFVALIIFAISKYVEFPNIKFFRDTPTKDDDLNLTPNNLSKNNLIRILVLIVSFYFIYINVMNDNNGHRRGKYSILFLLFIGFLTTIISLVYQHLLTESKEPSFEYNSSDNKVNFISWNTNTNNICYNGDNFTCNKLNKKQISLRDYSARIPLVISLIGLIIYSIFKNNKYSFVVNSLFIVILLTLIAGINFAEAGNIFNLNIANIDQEYSRVSAPLFSFFISYASDTYIIIVTIIASLAFFYFYIKTKLQDNINEQMKLIMKFAPIIIISLLFLAPLINIIILTFKDEGLKSNTHLHEIVKKVLNSKFNNDENKEGDINTIKQLSFYFPLVISSLFTLYLLYKSIIDEPFILNKGITFILVSGIFIFSFIYGRFIGLSNASPTELKPNLNKKIKNTRLIEKQLQNHLNIIRTSNNNTNNTVITIQNYDKLNKFFYIYFHGIDIINKYIIKDVNRYIPPIYRIEFTDDIKNDAQLQNAIYIEINKMKNFYKEKHNIELNFKFIKKDNKFQFYLYNFDLKNNSGDNEFIKINRGIKYNYKFIEEYFPKEEPYHSLMINVENKKFYKENNIINIINTLKESYYLESNFDRFAIIFDSNEKINNETNSNINSNNDNDTFNQQVKVLALENLENIKNTSSKYQNITTNCDINDNSWIQLYHHYYYNREYSNETYNDVVFKKDSISSNLKNVLGFNSRNINTYISTIYNSASKPSNNLLNDKNNGKKYNYVKLESNQEITESINIQQEGNQYTRQDCEVQNDTFTDYNYNFRL